MEEKALSGGSWWFRVDWWSSVRDGDAEHGRGRLRNLEERLERLLSTSEKFWRLAIAWRAQTASPQASNSPSVNLSRVKHGFDAAKFGGRLPFPAGSRRPS